MKKLDFSQLDHWLEQSLSDSLAWNKKELQKPQETKTAYEAGFTNGWQEAIKMLKLHAGLTITYGGK